MALAIPIDRTDAAKRLRHNCELIGDAERGDTRPLSKHLADMSLTYYADVRSQAQESFRVAAGMGVLGGLLFFFGAWQAMESPTHLTPAVLSAIGGALVQVISGIQLFMYLRASRQFASFHVCLERMNRFLLANTISYNLARDASGEQARVELVHVIATAPMLQLDKDGASATASAETTAKAAFGTLRQCRAGSLAAVGAKPKTKILAEYPMAKADREKLLAAPVRDVVKPLTSEGIPGSAVRTTAKGVCDDCRATTAFHAWHSFDLTPALNVMVSFEDWKIIPKGRRAVIELVTAEIIVPSGEWARLRMYTSLGSVSSNLDLFLTFQGNVSGHARYIATHSLRAYSDNDIDFNINRDNATTSGSGLICISGYIVG